MHNVIELKRASQCFVAAFGLIKQELSDLMQNVSLLHPQEIKYAQNLEFDRRKSSYLLGRVAAKKALTVFVGNENIKSYFIDFGIFNFPVIKSFLNHNLQISISHCDNIGFAVVFPEEHPLGIDIEKIDADKIDTIRCQLSFEEINLISINKVSPLIGYTMIWTAKEALSKIYKTGLTVNLELFAISSLEKFGSVYECNFLHSIQYKAISYYSGGYVCSIVLPKNTTPNLKQLWNSFIALTEEEIICY